jgi:hypothetical protein
MDNDFPTRMAGKYLPAFRREGGRFVPTQEMDNVLNLMQTKTDRPINIQPAPSVLAGIDGRGMWGSGGGLYRPQYGDAYIDPLSGSVTTAAHEAAHQAFGSKLINDLKAMAKGDQSLMTPFSTELVNDGTALRVGYESLSKPIMLEEANAQGVAYEAMTQAGYKPYTSGWNTMLSYPAEYRFAGQFDKAAPMYKIGFNKPGVATLMPGELDELQRINRSFMPAIERQFGVGRGMMR